MTTRYVILTVDCPDSLGAEYDWAATINLAPEMTVTDFICYKADENLDVRLHMTQDRIEEI